MEYITQEFSQGVYQFYGYLFKTIEEKGNKFTANIRHIVTKFESLRHKNLFSNILTNLPYFFSILFLGFLATIVIAINLEKDNGVRAINLTTGSMRPTIPIATIVFTRPSDKYQVGDIITYQEVSASTGLKFSRTFTHRIIDIKGSQDNTLYVTKGDANNLPDPFLIQKDNILGKVFLKIPYAGYLLALIKTFPGFLALIALPTLALITNEVRYIKREMGLK